jgi:hypothetical protein
VPLKRKNEDGYELARVEPMALDGTPYLDEDQKPMFWYADAIEFQHGVKVDFREGFCIVQGGGRFTLGVYPGDHTDIWLWEA